MIDEISTKPMSRPSSEPGPSVRRRARRSAAAGMGLVLCLAACAPGARVDPQPPANLGDRLTYSWAADITLNPRLGTRERLRRIDQLIRGTVDEELGRRGYQQIASGETDMIVRYDILLQDKNARTIRDYADYRSLGGESSAAGVLGGYTEGTLMIELLDGFSQQVLWQSSASAIPDVRSEGDRLPAVVRQMMAPLPMR